MSEETTQEEKQEEFTYQEFAYDMVGRLVDTALQLKDDISKYTESKSSTSDDLKHSKDCEGSCSNYIIGCNSNVLNGCFNTIVGSNVTITGTGNTVVGNDYDIVGNYNTIVNKEEHALIRITGDKNIIHPSSRHIS